MCAICLTNICHYFLCYLNYGVFKGVSHVKRKSVIRTSVTKTRAERDDNKNGGVVEGLWTKVDLGRPGAKSRTVKNGAEKGYIMRQLSDAFERNKALRVERDYQIEAMQNYCEQAVKHLCVSF